MRQFLSSPKNLLRRDFTITTPVVKEIIDPACFINTYSYKSTFISIKYIIEMFNRRKLSPRLNINLLARYYAATPQ